MQVAVQQRLLILDELGLPGESHMRGQHGLSWQWRAAQQRFTLSQATLSRMHAQACKTRSAGFTLSLAAATRAATSACSSATSASNCTQVWARAQC